MSFDHFVRVMGGERGGKFFVYNLVFFPCGHNRF